MHPPTPPTTPKTSSHSSPHDVTRVNAWNHIPLALDTALDSTFDAAPLSTFYNPPPPAPRAGSGPKAAWSVNSEGAWGVESLLLGSGEIQRSASW